MHPVSNGAPQLRRQYVTAAVVFSALLLGVLGLFAHLMVDQLSRRYLEDMLLSGQAYAKELAGELHGDGPLYKVVERRREALTKLSAALSQQEVWESIEIYDNRGRLVLRTTTMTEGFTGGFPEGESEFVVPKGAEPDVVETEKEYQIPYAVGDLGTVVLTASKPALQGRIAVLRKHLLINIAIAAGGSLTVLLLAVAFIWHLIQRNARLEQRRRLQEELATLGTLAANLAHEIRNPLNALSINLELLHEDLPEADGSQESVGLARREVDRLSRLVNDFLVYARPSPPSRKDMAVEDLVRDVAALLAAPCDRAGVSLAVDVDGSRIRGDRAQLSQVLVNLALNAVQAMEGGDQRHLTLAGRGTEESVLLEVSDSGPGIPEDDLEAVRQAFFSRRKGGTGLGLAIAERIVTAHGGTLELENRPEGGLTARAVLPRDV